jgi:hypothetical protein
MLQKTTLRNPKVAAITVKLPRPELDPNSGDDQDSEELLLEGPPFLSHPPPVQQDRQEADDIYTTRDLKRPIPASTDTKILRKSACTARPTARSPQSGPGPATSFRTIPIPTNSNRPITRSDPLNKEPGPRFAPGSGPSSLLVEAAAPPSQMVSTPLGRVVFEPMDGPSGPTSTLPYLLMGVGFGVLLVVGILGSLMM